MLADAQPPPTEEQQAERSRKETGLHGDQKITIKGQPANHEQVANVEKCLKVGERLGANRLAMLAMLCAGIGESSFIAQMNQGGSPYGGVFQGNVRGGVWELNDTEGMCESFFKGGKGFQGGGAIALSKQTPPKSPGEIALIVEGSKSNFATYEKGIAHYQTHIGEAEKILGESASGSLDSADGGETYSKQYNFEVGSTENPNETYWDAIQRLAQEVEWPFFLDEGDAYFDHEFKLIRQRVAAVVERDDPAFVNLSDATWDDRKIATSITLRLVCKPFQFRAGQAFQLIGFGPFSTGTTAKRPGVWLIESIRRNRFDPFSDFALVQPKKPKKEPAAEQAQRATEDTGSDGDPENAASPGEKPKGIVTPNRPWNPLRKPVAAWIVPILDWAADNGWKGTITSGYRDPNQVVSNAQGIVAAQGKSNHNKTEYPGGAIDVGDPSAVIPGGALAAVLKKYPHEPKLVQGTGISDYGHFSARGD